MAVLISGLIIGVTLGMFGSGGSALCVPILVYLVGHQAKESMAEAMAIVGFIAMTTAIPYAKRGDIHFPTVIYFGIPGMLGTYFGAMLGGLSTDQLQLIVFGIVLVMAAYVMLDNSIRKKEDVEPANIVGTPSHRSPLLKITLEGGIVGLLTGFVGVGGGFLIVPALVVLAKLPMRLAIGSSLAIIAIKSSVGFAKYQYDLMVDERTADPETIVTFALLGTLGSVAGKFINVRTNQQSLKKMFAIFLILIGGFVILDRLRNIMATPKEERQSTQSASLNPNQMLGGGER